MSETSISSPLLPGGSLIDATLDRGVMGLADKGGASGLVGARWADLCAEQVETWPGRTVKVPGSAARPAPIPEYRVDRVVRLDDTPAIAATAANRALQNPDFLIVGDHDGRVTLQAADAKFSVETARAKQVSGEIVAGMLSLGPLIGDLLGAIEQPLLFDGIFICPDFPLTTLLLRRKYGIVRTTVRPDQIETFAVTGARFFGSVPGSGIMAPLAGIDGLPVSIDESLLAALYYFRVARAAVGCWLDATGPLLAFNDKRVVDEDAVHDQVIARAAGARSAWDLIRRWDADVQTVRAQRLAVEQVAGLPVVNRDLRDLINQLSMASGVEAPSMNKVRRRIGAWYRGQLRDQFGPIEPPVENLPQTLRDLGRFAATLHGPLQRETVRIITQLLDEQPQGKPAIVSTPAASG